MFFHTFGKKTGTTGIVIRNFQSVFAHRTEESRVSDLDNLRTKRIAEICNFSVPLSDKMGYRQFHTLVIINTHIGSGRVACNIVIIKYSWSTTVFKILKPWIGKRKTDHKRPNIIMFQHINIIRLVALYLDINRFDHNIKSLWLRQLPESHNDIICKMIRFFILYIVFFY